MAISKKPNKTTVAKKQGNVKSTSKVKRVNKAKTTTKVKPIATQKLLIYGTGLIVALLVLISIASFTSKDEDNQVVANNFSSSDVISLESMVGSVSQGETFRVKIYTDSQETAINAVQATVMYPSSILKLQQVDNSSSQFTMDAIQNDGEGKVQVVRGVPGSGVTSKKLFTELEFVAIASGNADITFDTKETKVVESNSNQDILVDGKAKNVSVEVQ
jgi:hypothetical protein